MWATLFPERGTWLNWTERNLWRWDKEPAMLLAMDEGWSVRQRNTDPHLACLGRRNTELYWETGVPGCIVFVMFWIKLLSSHRKKKKSNVNLINVLLGLAIKSIHKDCLDLAWQQRFLLYCIGCFAVLFLSFPAIKVFVSIKNKWKNPDTTRNEKY